MKEKSPKTLSFYPLRGGGLKTLSVNPSISPDADSAPLKGIIKRIHIKILHTLTG